MLGSLGVHTSAYLLRSELRILFWPRNLPLNAPQILPFHIYLRRLFVRAKVPWGRNLPRGRGVRKRVSVDMTVRLCNLWIEEQGQDIVEGTVMLAVILVIVVGTIRLVGSNANSVFSSVANSVQ